MKSKRILYLGLASVALSACQQAPEGGADTATSEAVVIENDVQVYSYGVGYQIGSQMSQAPMDMDEAGLIAGLRDGLAQNEPLVAQERVQEVVQKLQGEMQEQQAAENKEQSEVNEKAAAEFLASNGKEEGVVTLETGLQYRVVTEGDGEKPKSTDTVLVHYRGRLIDGTEFDSSYSRGEPASFPVNAVIQGWQDALQLMSVGSKWEVFIPPELAYGSGGTGPIPPSSALIFDVELLEITPAS